MAAITAVISTLKAGDLVLAEVELSSASERPALPDWLAPHVVREVTDDPRFTNLALAESGGVPA